MRQILYLTCSPRGAVAYSRLAGDALVDMLRARHPEARIARRDLAADPPPLVDAAFSAAILSGDGTAPALAASEALITELEAADAVVIATPMHNYSVPAVLKAWIDQVVRINRGFRSTPQGKVGLLADRPVFVVIASGGWFTGPSPSGVPAQPDFLRPYLAAALGTIGLRDVQFVPLEGATRGVEVAAAAMDRARAAFARLVDGEALSG